MRITTLLSLTSFFTPFASSRSWTPKDPCPTSIKTTIASDPCSHGPDGFYCTDEIKFSTMDSVHSALSHCPNITALDLRVTGLGCSDWPERYDFPFHPWGGEKFANLTSLRLEGYDFGRPGVVKQPRDDNAQPNLAVQWMHKFMSLVRLERTEQGFLKPVPNKTHLDLWLDAMDWSGVEELMIDDITDEIMQKLPAKLRGLRKLETRNRTFIETLDNNTLTHLTWVGESEASDLPTILAHQGQSLQHLEFRAPEHSNGPFLADFDISLLSNMTRNLTHVSMNVPRNGTWPLDTLSVISSLPKLQSADIFMNIQSQCAQQRPLRELTGRAEWNANWTNYCVGEDQFQQPFLSKTGADLMFAHIKQRRGENQLAELANVTFYVGDWTRGWDGPLYFPAWLEGKAAKVVCQTEGMEKDDWCVVERGENYWTDGYRDEYMDDDW